MKKLHIRLLLGAIATPIALILLLAFYLVTTTFSHTGQDARLRMNKEERAYMVKLNSIRRNMTYDQVKQKLGEPDREALGLRPTWIPPGGGALNQVAVYFNADGNPWKVRWMKIGSFVYETAPD